MCGIAGFLDFKNQSSGQVLDKMTQAIAHRGPDGSDKVFLETSFCQVGLGHRRLSIIDLSNAASQPMWYKHFCLIFNGELYNYEEVKAVLAEKGHSFKTHSDTEVLLHAYEEWGADAMHHFVGMFAFVIYDQQKDILFACRDRAGVKPFFYGFHDGLFIFASELKAITAHQGFVKELNLDAAASYMQFGYVPTPHCIYKNTYKLKPGHFLTFSLAGKKFETHQYWSVYDAYNKPSLKIDLPDALTETEKVLSKAFEYRMVSDVPVGIFLSGGYDSTCVTALLQKDKTEKLKTFTIGVPSAGLNEAPYAKDIAKHLGTDHTEYYCTQEEAMQIVPDLPFFYDEPFADSSAIPTTLVSRIARKDVTVALSADAGDEIFAGYNRYDYIMKYGKALQALPNPLRKVAAGFMNKISADDIPVLNKKYLFHSRYEKLKGLLSNPSEYNIMLSITRQMNDDDVKNLFLNNIDNLGTALDSKELKKEYYSTLPFIMAIDYETYLLDDILQKVDRATMSVSLEGREPFLDQHIIEWAAQLPTEYKYNKGNKKFILKQIVNKYVPHQLMDRPKMGFGIPIADWLLGDLKPLVDQFLDETYVKQQAIFVTAEVQRIKSDFFNGKKEKAEKIWHLLVFQMWYDKWMKN